MAEEIHFSEIGPAELDDLLSQIIRKKTSLKVWTKGSQHKEEFTPISTNQKNFVILLDQPEFQSKIIDEKTLIAFEVKGNHFFSEGRLLESKRFGLHLKLDGKIFKCERRKNFRVPVFESNNVSVTIESKRLEAFDISVSGMSFLVTDEEVEFFQEKKAFLDIELNFDGEKIDVPEVEVVYIMENKTQQKRAKPYKMALEFKKIPTRLDTFLSKKIHQAFRDQDIRNNFEKFIS